MAAVSLCARWSSVRLCRPIASHFLPVEPHKVLLAPRCRRWLSASCRRASSIPCPRPLPSTMSAWQIHEYGELDQLTMSSSVRLPAIRRPEEVLVEVHAASVNPVDVWMVGGYGLKTLNVWRRLNCTLHNGSEFPLTLGRDFSGRIVETGRNVDRQTFSIGDEVWGAGDVAYPGTHAQYVVVSSKEISHKPRTVTHVEAASLPYVAATAWAAICTLSGYDKRNLAGRRVLLLGGSGGVGTFTIQLLKAWGAHVTTTCASDAVTKVLELGADIALDYTQYDVEYELRQLRGFDLIFDAVGGETAEYAPTLLRPYSGATYVSIVVPILQNNDDLGVACGTAKTGCQLSAAVTKGLQQGVNIRWALFMPSGSAMKTVADLVDEGKIRPQVELVFPFVDLPAAFMKVGDRHSRGKTVIDVIGAEDL